MELRATNDDLVIARDKASKLELESIPFSLRDQVRQVLKPLAVKAEHKGLELRCDIDPDVPSNIMGDKVRLQQVLTNLISNAIKFTEHGRVSLSVGETARGDGCTMLYFQVADTGIGIAAIKVAIDGGDADAIRSAAHALKGAAGNMSATGLFEAARTLERIGAEGRFDSASAAWRHLSSKAAEAIGSAPASCGDSSNRGNGMHVLVADDDEVTAAILTRTLERRGLEVLVERDGDNAWDLLQSNPGPVQPRHLPDLFQGGER